MNKNKCECWDNHGVADVNEASCGCKCHLPSISHIEGSGEEDLRSTPQRLSDKENEAYEKTSRELQGVKNGDLCKKCGQKNEWPVSGEFGEHNLAHDLPHQEDKSDREEVGQILDDVYTHEITIAEGVDKCLTILSSEYKRGAESERENLKLYTEEVREEERERLLNEIKSRLDNSEGHYDAIFAILEELNQEK